MLTLHFRISNIQNVIFKNRYIEYLFLIFQIYRISLSYYTQVKRLEFYVPVCGINTSQVLIHIFDLCLNRLVSKFIFSFSVTSKSHRTFRNKWINKCYIILSISVYGYKSHNSQYKINNSEIRKRSLLFTINKNCPSATSLQFLYFPVGVV